jgi:hypothetical protein
MDVDILIVASNDSTLPEPDWGVFQYPAVAADLQRFRPITPEALEGIVLASRNALAPLVRADGLVNSDYRPVLDLGAERTRYRKTGATGFIETTSDRFDLLAALDERRIGFGTETNEAIALPRVQLRALGARLHANAPLPANDSVETDREYRKALTRRENLRDVMAARHAPVDWFTWFRGMLEVERDVHVGVSGVIDTAFYAEVDAYLTRWNAPQAARSAWRFKRTAGTYDWPSLAAEVAPQLKSRVAGHSWLPVDLLRDAGVLALVRTGDRVTARKVFDSLAPYSTRTEDDLRTRLLQALVARRTAARTKG